MGENRSCREFMKQYDDTTPVNCATCVKWDRKIERCSDEAGVVQRYVDNDKDAKDIRLD